MSDDVSTLRFPWVNDDQPWPISHGLLTADDQRKGILAKIATLNHDARLMDKDLPEAAQAAIMAQVRQAAAVNHFNAILFNVVRRHDARLRSKTDDELAALLTTDQFEAFMEAVAAPPAKEGAPAPLPLPQPKSSGA